MVATLSLIALATTTILLFFARRILTVFGVLDVPNHRSSHSQVTVRGAGIALLVGLIVAVSLCTVVEIDSLTLLFSVFIPAFIVAVVGFVEDVRGLSMKTRLCSQIVIGIALGICVEANSLPRFLWVFICGVSFAAYVNFANFMDGINGISGLHGFVVGGSFFLFGVVESTEWLQIAGALIAVVFLAFLPANFRKPGMFLGDVGSYLLGGSIAAVSIVALAQGLHWFVVLSPLVIYLFDTIFTILNRFRRGESIVEAHRSHIYQKLTIMGFSHLSSALVVTIFTVLNSLVGFCYLSEFLSIGPAILIVVLLCVAYGLTPALIRKNPNA
ncbi:MraY family glycosyltransferase [Corynebacterium glutamicum]|uniref:MraY family glycosyltransferase n=1 Tax=Corynebacterium glutamicum TaxID=1718 RepID=UPI000A6C6E47|nr:glycosyltransferase family 4 protein [Corynebacterium glutamicum]